MRSLDQANALLEAQRAQLAGDDHVRREVAASTSIASERGCAASSLPAIAAWPRSTTW